MVQLKDVDLCRYGDETRKRLMAVEAELRGDINSPGLNGVVYTNTKRLDSVEEEQKHFRRTQYANLVMAALTLLTVAVAVVGYLIT